jgi:hypothetical protein
MEEGLFFNDIWRISYRTSKSLDCSGEGMGAFSRNFILTHSPILATFQPDGAHSSVGESAGLTYRRSLVQVQLGPPMIARG